MTSRQKAGTHQHSGKQQNLASPALFDDLQQPDQAGPQQSSDIVMLAASDSEDHDFQGAAHNKQQPLAPACEPKATVAAAAARLAARQHAHAARAAAAADAVTISDSEEDNGHTSSASEARGEGSSEHSSGDSGSESDDEPSNSGQQQQHLIDNHPRTARGQQQQERQQHGAQPGQGRPQQGTGSSSSGDSSDSSDESSESSSSGDSTDSESDDDDDDHTAPQAHTRQPTKQRAPSTAATGTPSRSSRAPQHTTRLEAAATNNTSRAAGTKAAGTKGATQSNSQHQHQEAATPSRPVRSCTQTPQRSTRSAAAAAAAPPGLSTPLGKLSLANKAAAAATPSTAARATRTSTRIAGQAAGTHKTPTAAAATTGTPAGKQQRQKGASSSVAAAGAAGAATPGKKRGPRGASSSKVVVLPQVVVDDEVILPGDDVYLMLDEYDQDDDDEDQEEACEVCSSSRTSRANAMLECSTCLRGFHMRCLKPALKQVPEGDWCCPSCNAGEAPAPPSRLVSHWQKLLYGTNQLALVHVLGLQRGKSPEGEDEDQMLVRYYILPQDTHLGRQQHHAAREVFLGTKEYIEPACAVVGHGYVHSPAGFAEAPEAEGNDVFLCEYEYDEAWKRFRKRRYGECGPEELGGANGSCPMTPAALRLTPGKGKSPAAAGNNGGRRLFGGNSSGESDGGYSCDSDDEGDDNYRPEPHHLSNKGKFGVLSKRKRQGQLPGTAADKFVGLGASDIGRDRGELKDAFAKLHSSLSLGAVPDSLPCREEERKRLGGFLNRALTEDGGVLYICGVPGTGKTALVMEMLRGMRSKAQAAGAQLVVINCLQLPTPQHVFSRLWEKLSGQHLGPARACEALMQSFGINGSGANRRRHYSTIIVLDEIDMLMTRDQAVLYQVFDWPNQPGSRLAVIGISNTHDLDQRVLPRIASRLDQAKLAFAPYSVSALNTIVGQRLQDSGVAGAVEDMAVMLACRKVASETGDVRRALELLRRAVEIGRAEHLRNTVVARMAAAAAAKQTPPADIDVVVEWQEGAAALVRRPHVTQAQQEMFGALHLQLLRSRSLWEKLLLVAVVVEARATGRSAVVIQSVAERASNSICALVDLVAPPLGVLQHCLVKLSSVRLLLSDGCHIKAQVALNVDKDDVGVAIKEDERLQALHQLL